MQSSPPTTPIALPSVAEQAERLIALGLNTPAGLSASTLRTIADASGDQTALLVVHPELMPASTLAPLLTVNARRGIRRQRHG